MAGRHILIMLLLLGISCRTETSEMTPKQFKQFVESDDSGLGATISAGEIEYKFRYKPALYVAGCEQAWSIDASKLETRKRSLRGTVWFNVEVCSKERSVNPLKNKVSGIVEYNDRLSYFLNSAGRNFRLLYNDKEAPQLSYFFENNYGLTPSDVMIVGFRIPDEEPVHEMTLQYDDELFGGGPVKMRISTADLNRIRKIKVIL